MLPIVAPSILRWPGILPGRPAGTGRSITSLVPSARGNVDEPGGGKRVRVTDPLDYNFEFICDHVQLASLPVTPVDLNLGWDSLKRKHI